MLHSWRKATTETVETVGKKPVAQKSGGATLRNIAPNLDYASPQIGWQRLKYKHMQYYFMCRQLWRLAEKKTHLHENNLDDAVEKFVASVQRGSTASSAVHA